MQLTQKEKTLLQDALGHEEVCIWKYKDYAGRVSDPALQQMFTTHASHEQTHYDSINSLLQGQQPSMGQGNQSAGKGQGMQPQGGQGWTYGSSATGGGSKEDSTMCSDMLSAEKYVSSTYDTSIFEAACPEVRQALQHIQKEEQQHGEHIFQYMQQHGMYNVK